MADFGRYPFKAMSTFGTVDDYKHFLPRILELAFFDPAARTVPGFDVEVVGGKLSSAGWLLWEARERNAIQALLRACAAQAFAAPSDDCGTYALEEVLRGVAAAGLDLRPILVDEVAGLDQNRCSHLIALATGCLTEPRRSWCSWLASAQAKDALDKAFFEAPDTARGACISSLRAMLDGLQQ